MFASAVARDQRDLAQFYLWSAWNRIGKVTALIYTICVALIVA